MSNVVGQLTIDMVANVARLQRDMEQAKRSVGTAMGSIQRTVDLAKKALIGLGGVLAAGQFVSFIKGAIDSADEVSKMSQKIGVAVKDVAGLQLAFRQSGLEAGALQASMARLSLGIANGNRALETMGVTTRNVDGTLKTTRQVLGEVADRFASYQDGAGKAALAIELFGKAGADLIPLLNGGSQALDDFDAMALKLGLTLDEQTAKQAELFNDTLDLMGQGVQGVGRQIAAQLLPTLSGLAGEFFNTMSEGDRLQKVANFLSNALRGLYIAGISIIEVFNTVGKVLGGVSAAVVAALSGNFSQAADILRNMKEDIGEGWQQTLEDAKRAWTTTGDAAIESMAAAQGAARRAAPAVKQLENATKRQAEAQRLMNKELDDYFAAEEKARLEKEKSIGSAREMVEQIEFETAALKMTNTEREIAIKLRELERRGIREGSREYEEFSKRIREAVIGKEAVAASIEQQRKAQAGWDKTWEQVAQSFTDALMQGGKSVKEYLVSLFRTMVLRPLLQPIIAGGASLMGGVANAMGFGPAGAGAGGTMNVLTMAKGAYDAIAGGFTAIGNSVAFAADTMGAWLVNNTSGVLNQMGGSLMQSAGSLGTAASYLGGAAAGMALGSVISGQFAAFGNANVSNIAGTAIGAMLGGPIGAAIGGAIGGIVNRAFGMGAPTITKQGIAGYIDPWGQATKKNIKSFADVSQKGGLFRSDKSWREWSNLSQGVIDQFNQAAFAIFNSARNMGRSLGEVPKGLDGFLFYFKSSGKNIEKVMGRFADKLTLTLFPAIAGFVREGETAYEALMRLSAAANTFNQVFDTLGHTMRANTLATADAAERLINLFGGTEQFVKATSDYYREFYTEAERAATTTRQLTEVLGTMGLQLPASRQAFRDLVEAQDLTTEAGRQTYAALLNLAPAFASISASMVQLEQVTGNLNEVIVVSAEVLRERESLERQLLTLQGDTTELRRRDLAAIDESNRAILERIFALQDEQEAAQAAAQAAQEFAAAMEAQYQESRTATDAALAAVNRAIDAQKQIAMTARDVAQESVRSLQTIFDILKSNIEDLYGVAGAGMTAAQGRAFVDQAIMSAQTTGYLPDADQLRQAITAARSGADYATSFEMRRDQLVLANRLAVLRDLTGDQLSVAEKQLLAAEAQLEKLDAQMELAQQQVDALRGVDNSIMSLAAAMAGLSSAMAAERTASAAAQQAAQSSGAASQTKTASQIIEELYQSGGYASAATRNQATFQAWVDYAEKAGALATQERWQELGNKGTISGFAAGGLHMGGLRMVGETGPELEVTGPARYFSASQTANMMGGGAEVAQEIRNLREENKAQARALVGLQSRMTRLLERWDNDGVPEERDVTA